MNRTNPAGGDSPSRARGKVMRHEYLTKDRTVQRTMLRCGWRVTVNFGVNPFPLSGGASLSPMSFRREPCLEGVKHAL